MEKDKDSLLLLRVQKRRIPSVAAFLNEARGSLERKIDPVTHREIMRATQQVKNRKADDAVEEFTNTVTNNILVLYNYQ